MRLSATGSNGLSGLSATLKADEVTFCVLPAVIDGRTRFWFLAWVGPEVSAMKRGRVGMQKGAARNAFDGLVAECTAGSREELAPSVLAERLGSLLGFAPSGIEL